MKEIPLTDILALDILDQEIRELDRQRRDLIESAYQRGTPLTVEEIKAWTAKKEDEK